MEWFIEPVWLGNYIVARWVALSAVCAIAGFSLVGVIATIGLAFYSIRQLIRVCYVALRPLRFWMARLFGKRLIGRDGDHYAVAYYWRGVTYYWKSGADRGATCNRNTVRRNDAVRS